MVTTNLKINIDRPISMVYEFLMELDNYLLWQSGLVNVKATNGMAVGSVIDFASMGMGRRFTLKAVVKHNDGHSTFTVVSSQGPVTFESTYQLEQRAEGTNLHLTNKINTGMVFKLAEGVLQSISDARYEGDLQGLKAILESQT